MPGSTKYKRMFDKFDIIKVIKQDACSAVYIADHIYLGKKIFLKTLNTENLPDTALLTRFKREAKTLARLDHPNIIKVFDFGSWKNYFYISFEYFESRNLRGFIKESALTDEQKISLVGQMASALKYAHQNQIIHRDIKPENILVDETLHLKIADFGLALVKDETSVTSPTSIVGTPAYMSPEQIRGEDLTNRSDLFSFGIIIYELYFANNPFLGNDAGQTINNILNKAVDLKNDNSQTVPDGLHSLLTNLLNKNSIKRTVSFDEIFKMFPPPDNNINAATAVSLAKPAGLFRPRNALLFILILVLSIAGYYLRQAPEAAITENMAAGSITQNNTVDSPVFTDTTAAINTKSDTQTDQSKLKSKTESIKADPVLPAEEKISIPGELQVECSPWAYIYIDSARVDSTPLNRPISLLPGNYQLGLEHPEYPYLSQQIHIEPEKTTYFKVDLDTLVGTLFVRVFPWADIFIDGEYRGQTPLKSALHLTPGTHKITIRNPLFKDVVREYIALKQRSDTLAFHLKDLREMSQNETEHD